MEKMPKSKVGDVSLLSPPLPSPSELLVQKTGALKYYIPDDGARIQEGVLEGGINVNIVRVGHVAPYRAAQGLTHSSFLRLYYVDDEQSNLVFERWTSTLEDWLAKGGIFQSYRPKGFHEVRWKVRQQIKDCIRYIMYGVMHLHRRGLCFDQDLRKDNVVLVGNMPKFVAVQVRAGSAASITSDYQNLRRLVKHTIFRGAGNKVPGDMLHLLDLMAHYLSKNKELLENHCSLWTDMEQMDFFERFIDGGKLVDATEMMGIYRKLDAFPEILNWKREVEQRMRTIVYKVYGHKTRIPGACGHYTFLRDYRSHAGDYSENGALYQTDMVQDAIIATFPCSLCYLQDVLHKNNMLMDFIPRKRETALE